MPDSLALPAITFAAVGLVALALVWPQGHGAPSPPPFGHRAPVSPAQAFATLKQQARRIEALSHPLANLRGPEETPKPAAPMPASPSH